MWIGTPHGLNRFDGYGCMQYFNFPGDTASLSSSHISPRAFAEDAAGNLWVATFRGGLNYFNRKTERFTRYKAQPGQPNSLSMDKLFAIEPDGKEGLWIATAGRGINYFNPGTEQFRAWGDDKNRPGVLMGSTMTGCLKLDKAGKLWIGTNNGVCRFDPENESFGYYPFITGVGRSLSDKFVTSITEDREGNIWIGTAHGLNRWNAFKGIFEKYFFAYAFPEKEPGYDYILDVLEDEDGKLWIGTVGGLLRFNPADGTFERFLRDTDNPFSILRGAVNTILKDRNGCIWFGTNNGISILNKTGEKLSHDRFLPVQNVFKTIAQTEGINAVLEVEGALWLATQTGIYHVAETLHLIKHGNFTTLFWDKEKKEVYAGTVDNGIFVINAENFIQIRHFPKNKTAQDTDPYAVKGNRITSIAKDDQGFIWVAADGGLNRYHPATGRFRKFFGKQKKLSNPSANTNHHLLADSKGNMWFASMGGLSRLSKAELSKPFDHADLHFEHFLHQPGNRNSISSDVVFCLLESADGHIWAGTDAGLSLFEPKKASWQWFFKTDGLPGNDVTVLVEDRNGDIWAGSAHEGLAKFDRAGGRFFRFTKKDGLVTDHFRPNAGWCTAEGFVVLGGRAGLVGFHPDSLLQRASAPPSLYFTDFKIFNKSVPIGQEDNQLFAPVYQTDVIELDYAQKVISFQCTALNFVSPEKQVYRYRLIPFHADWQDNGNNREVTFTNLDPATYQLQIEASENGYDWTGKSLTLRILPPWYRSWWAYLLYALAIGGILLGIRRFEIRRELAKAETRRLRELDAVKTRLYTNITHEFRTPLTVILGEAAQIEKHAGGKQKSGLAAIRRQGRQLLNLVNQMLDLAKVEAGSLSLNVIQGNVILFLKYLLESFRSLADGKQIELRFEADTKEFWMDYDPDKLQKIATNLLSNAIKFTSPRGLVTLKLEIKKSEIEKLSAISNPPISDFQFLITVTDTGPGIPMEKIPFIFDRFYQADDSTTRQAEGTGIGLTLTKELVHLLGGQISAESRPGEGSTFTVILPVACTAEKQLFDPESFFAENQELKPEPETSVAPVPQFPISSFNKNRPHLLLVEDNADVVRYISSLLAADYQVYKAENGKEGVKAAFRLVPDIIISDVMMPEMDGFELCRILKTDERTSHIPIILLTAKADHASKIEGLTQGADVYLAKPFDREELLVHLEKLIELRRRLQERYAGFSRFVNFKKVDKSDVLDSEERFLQKAIRVVAAQMSDEDFDMPQLCKALHMSRSNLFRKLKALTGRSATDFIRTLRLEKAKELLETTDLNVTEVCFKVGFGSPNYFSRAFQEQFGISPSELRRK
ncbi:MAG: Sensor histidine kinase RcsC [Saprospiraceae bacterium]|nr:Sensor histidine kinase RcsC [Saprospiraceae bacterium]